MGKSKKDASTDSGLRASAQTLVLRRIKYVEDSTYSSISEKYINPGQCDKLKPSQVEIIAKIPSQKMC